MGKNLFWSSIREGEFVISVQIDPPAVSSDIVYFRKALRTLKRYGVWLVDINSSRRISHDSVDLSLVLSGMGFATIPHITARDNSVNGILNKILVAYSWGNVRNFLIITGDPYDTRHALVPSPGVFQADAIGVLHAIDKYLRREKTPPCRIKLAAAVNQNAEDIGREGERLKQKIRAGVDFFMSQPVFNEQQLYHLVDFYRRYSAKPLLVGIWPLLYPRTLELIESGLVTGVALPHEIYEEGKRLDDEEDLLAWGMENALRLIETIREEHLAQGVYIVAPSRNPLSLTALLQRLRKAVQ